MQTGAGVTDLPPPRVWCNKGLVLRCTVFGVPTMCTMGTCSEKAGAGDGLSEWDNEQRMRRTSSDAVDRAQFPNTEPGKRFDQTELSMT